ncbi:MAG: hypothetical protein OXS28_12765 [Gammaproteobacteria bacterium]|nr:hypothetical protein [Gammaproteobacteria bacterium]MDE0286615.1 hypothetical protein [Gammaproteobacteria bacterium]
MNRNIVFAAIVLIAAATAYSFISLDGTVNRHETGADGVLPGQAGSSLNPEPGPAQVAERKRREAMRAEYEKLEQARDGVRKQLATLKSRLWKLRVPPDRARAIQEQLAQGHALLKNPPLLGAFSSVDEIAGEMEKVSGVNARLEALGTDVEALLAAREPR